MKTTSLPLFPLLLAASLVTQSAPASKPPTESNVEPSETTPAVSAASTEIQPGPAVIAGRNVNIRSKATIHSEVVTQLQDGDAVIVEEVILRTDAKGNDPARWAKITYPTAAAAWVHSLYVDAATKTVKPKKLNVRSGPGENFTIVGQLKAGDAITQTGTNGDWIKIEAPGGSTAFVAAKLLRQEAPAVVSTPAETPTVAYTPAEVAAEPEIVTAAEVGEIETSTTPTSTESTSTETSMEPLPVVSDEVPEVELPPAEPLPPRIVQREGIVRSFTSIQAPSEFKLVSAENGKNINYLYTTSTNLDLSRYVGLHIIASGEEWLDKRWPNMPVLTLQKIYLVD